MDAQARATRWYFLVGFMGVGKSTLGAAVAARLGLPFFDLDERIALAAGAGIREIFESEGEASFRRRETEMLANLIESEPAGVMATGGGTFTREVNRELIAKAGIAVWLDAPIDVIASRIRRGERPLWKSDRDVRDLAERRRAHYRLAHHRLELGADPAEEAASRLYELLASHRNDP